MHKYHLEFILNIHQASRETLRNSLVEFAEALEISDCQDTASQGKNLKIQIVTQDPTIIFDTCAQFGRIKSVKVHEERRH